MNRRRFDSVTAVEQDQARVNADLYLNRRRKIKSQQETTELYPELSHQVKCFCFFFNCFLKIGRGNGASNVNDSDRPDRKILQFVHY